MVDPAQPEFEVDYEPLRRRLLRVALGHGVAPDDVEDVVQDALTKALGERVRAGAPPPEVRAFAALRDKEVEHWRRRARRDTRFVPFASSAVLEEDGYESEPAVTDRGFALFELRELIEAIAGRDVMNYALLSACGATEGDIAIMMGWPPTRAAAARVRFGRKKAQLAAAVIDALD